MAKVSNPIEVKEQIRYEGLGYDHSEFGECSNIFEENKSPDDYMPH